MIQEAATTGTAAKAGAAGATVAKAVPAAKAAMTAALSAAKAVIFSPAFGIVALGGLFVWGIWYGKREIRKSKK